MHKDNKNHNNKAFLEFFLPKNLKKIIFSTKNDATREGKQTKQRPKGLYHRVLEKKRGEAKRETDKGMQTQKAQNTPTAQCNLNRNVYNSNIILQKPENSLQISKEEKRQKTNNTKNNYFNKVMAK